MHEIKFKFHHRWDAEESVARRVAQIIRGDIDHGFPVFEPENFGDRWNLDSSNNWFLRIDFLRNTASLKYRYGSNNEFMNGLQKVLEWVFNSPD